jgi:hypothetical protein
MKPILPLLCAVLLGATAMVATPMVSQAAVGDGNELAVGLGVGLLIGQQDDDRRHRRDNGDDRKRDDRKPDERRDNGNDRRDAPVYDRRDNGGGGYDRRGGGGEQRDDRINRAIAIGQGRGRVLNAWPQGGSLFMVRVDTPRGRVDIVIDVDTGRIVGER